VLFRIPPRNSRAIAPAMNVCAFRKHTRRLPPSDGAVAIRGGIASAPAKAGARRTRRSECLSSSLSISCSTSSIYSHASRSKARATIRAFKGQSRGLDTGMLRQIYTIR